MNRRQFVHLASTAAAGWVASTGISRAASGHEGHAHGAAAVASPLAEAFGACAATSSQCIAHCQKQLATGDKSMAECLKTSLDCDAICEAVAKLARFDSAQAPVFARAAIPAMKACAEACKPHAEHHAACKACYDACNAAIGAANAA